MKKKIIISIVLLAGFCGLVYIMRYLILGGVAPATPAKDTISQTTERALRDSTASSESAVGASPVLESKEFDVKSTKYFNDKKWAVVNIVPKEREQADPAYLVVHQRAGSYQTIIGPGTLFPADQLEEKGIPQAVIDHLDSLGLVGSF